MIPAKLKLEGMVYRVIQISNEQINTLKREEEIGDICGFTEFEDNNIYLNSKYGKESQHQTLLHELIHISDSRMNPLTEEQIDNLARRLFAIIRDNPKLFTI
jgi:uncharacterized protein YaaR (DUF327 family)